MSLARVMDNIVKKIAYQRYGPMIENFTKESIVILEYELKKHNKKYDETIDATNWIMNSFHINMVNNIKKTIEIANEDFFEWGGAFLQKDKLKEYESLRKTVLDNTEIYIYNKINQTKGGK